MREVHIQTRLGFKLSILHFPFKLGPEIKTRVQYASYAFTQVLLTLNVCLHDYVKFFPRPPAGKGDKIVIKY